MAKLRPAVVMGYIVRLDKPKDAPHGTHAWQVRGSGKRNYHSKLFSDNQYGGPEPALAAAKAYLQSYAGSQPAPRIPANKPYHRGRVLSTNTSGITGVYYTEYAHRWDKERLVGYWGLLFPKGQKDKIAGISGLTSNGSAMRKRGGWR